MSTPQRPQDGTGILIDLGPEGILQATSPSVLFSTVPADTTAGFAPGCTFVKRDGAAGAEFYVNEGTLASCAFKIDDAMTGLTATIAELNANNHAATRLIDATAALTVTQLLHDGKTILLDAAGGLTCTLPGATGSGARYKFVVKTVSTTGYIIKTGDQGGADTDIIQGQITTLITTSATGKAWAAATNSNTITLNGTTSGGVDVGDTLLLEDIASGVYSVFGSIMSSGVMITPFSHV